MPGPKPRGDHPLTPAERQAAYRARQQAALEAKLKAVSSNGEAEALASLHHEAAGLREQGTKLRAQVAKLQAENIALRGQLAQPRAAAQATPKAAPRPPPDPDTEAGRWRSRALLAEKKLRHIAAQPKGQLVISAADRRAIQRCLHPDTSTDPAHQKRLTKAMQIFNGLPMTEVDLNP